MYKKIIVGYDRSDNAKQAMQHACAIAKAFSSELYAVHTPQLIGDTMVVGYNAVPVPPTADEIEKAGKDALAEAAAIARNESVEIAGTYIGYGDPAGAIVKYAKAIDGDLIVLGRRGLGSFTSLLMGSVTTKVCQLADCAVLTTKEE
ncbi:MAG: universal stress protein [Pseudomonadota bacterium]